jgi:TPR repeat protein
MAEVFVAAAPGQEAQAKAFADALTLLGYKAEAGAPTETDIAKKADEAKCVLVLWSVDAAGAPWVAARAILALDRKNLVNAELESGTTPAPFQSAPKVDLLPRDRTRFKKRFEALIVELDKLSPTKADQAKVIDAVAQARAGLLAQPIPERKPRWRLPALMVAGVAALFVVGFGTGRIVQAVRSGTFTFALPSLPTMATPQADAAPTAAAAPDTSALTLADLRTRNWRDIAGRIDETTAERIKADAGRGDALAQTLACIGHMAGASGFLPSPTAAREQCDAGAAQNNPAALYFSWVLHREAPHAGIVASVARERLAQAAQLNWTPAQVDYALVLAPDASAPVESQAEAGRLLLAAAESGDPRGQYQYARWLRDSRAGPRDPAAAIPFLDRAATGGQLEAAHMLATLYRDGIGAPRNEARAKALYEQAARGHYAPAMFNLADMLRGGSDEERARAIALYGELACMPDERQIQPLASARLRALQQSAACR